MNSIGLDSVSRAVPLFDEAVLSLDLTLAIVFLSLFSLVISVPRALALLSKLLAAVWLPEPPAAGKPTPVTSLPHVSSTIPFIGHALELRRRGAQYVHRLILSTPAPLFTINILAKRLIVVNPSLDRALARHAQDTSLSRVVLLIGQRSLNLSAAAVRTISEHDPRPVHAQLFSSSRGAASLSEASAAYVRERLRPEPRVQQVQLGRWLFDLVVGASAHALWGAQNPWNADQEFMRQFVIMSDRFESLSQPLPWLTARPAYRARELLIDRLMAFHREHRASREGSVAHSINAIAMNDPCWEDNVDYYRCELLEALGLLATASTLSVWLVRHLLVDQDLRRKVVDEVRKLNTVAAEGDESGDGRLDLSDIRTTCPHLAAAWYETLRLHVTIVPRVASHDFDLDVSSHAAPVPIHEGDVFLLPMLSFNMDPRTWGPDAASFSAERFIDGAGRLLTQRTRKVRGFGVAGNLCPGRTFGFDTAMAAAVSLLRGFDIETVGGAAFAQPTPLAATNVGFERLADDVPALLTRVDRP